MTTKPTKTGKYLTFQMTEDEFHDADNDYQGYCIACGAPRDECEPDARKYPCDNCEKNLVFGLQELLLMGFVSIKCEKT